MATPLEIKNKMMAKDRPNGQAARSLWTKLSYVLIGFAGLCGIATYAALTETPPLGNDPNTVLWLLNIDFVILLAFVVLIARRIVSLWSGRKRKLAGSHLHVRLVYTFSLLAAAPAIVMTVFSAFFFHFGVQAWFSQRVQTAVDKSYAVAQAYLEEHKQVIRADTLAMANDLDRQAVFLSDNQAALDKLVRTQSILRNLSEAIVFDTSGRIYARSGLTFSLEFESVPDYALQDANLGDVALMTGSNDDRVRALVKLNNYVDRYLFVGRMVDPEVLSHLSATKEAAEDYADLQARYSSLQITVTMIFVVVGLVLLMIAIWFGLILARQLVQPISALIKTTDRVRAGDLSARVPDGSKLEEFDYLAKAFNRMTIQIQEQRNELIEANKQLDRRRRLIETVLTGVSSGVVGVDKEHIINLANSAVASLLSYDEKEMTGQNILSLIPEVSDFLRQAHERPEKTTQAEVPIIRGDGSKRTYLVRIVIELVGEQDVGAILTFDDMTDLQAAQRKAAWADVARRIAHEIKNPLTPIQLSAERLRRKYKGQITDDIETFMQCTDTIIKHVEDIGRMVSEFSSFARLPEPKLEQNNLQDVVSDALFLQKQAHSGIDFDVKLNGKKKDFVCYFDGQQLRQALNNLLQNAADALEEQDEAKIQLYLTSYGGDELAVIVNDNGPGFPQGEDLNGLTEPYITHKVKGTGLGLAIVKKIMEDHNGALYLGVPHWLAKDGGWFDLGGATLALILPRQNIVAAQAVKKKKAAG